MLSSCITNLEMPPSINFHYPAPSFSFRNRTKLKSFLARLFKKENRLVNSLNIIFCTDDYLLKINKKYLNHSYYTDIVTFNLANSNQSIIGEIYISIDRIRENAITFNSGFERELHRVIFHGALHLCGYDDHSKSQVQMMRKKEAEYLQRYFG